MSLPALSAQSQGIGSLSADNLNTYLQQCDTATQLRGFSGLTGMKIMVGGSIALGDGGAGLFYWNSASTAADDGSTVIAPTGTATGRWIRIGYVGAPALTVGATALAADGTIVIPAMYGIASIFVDNRAGQAVTGGLRIGTTNGGAEVVSGLAVGASALFKAPSASILLGAFSLSAPTTLYIQAVTAWNGASLNVTFNLVPFL